MDEYGHDIVDYFVFASTTEVSHFLKPEYLWLLLHWHKYRKAIRREKKDRYLSYSDFSANEGRRATDGRERDLTTTSLLTRLLRNRGQESVTAASCHLRNSNRIADM